jgi:Na+-transporting NADH:ubiquinone oxidoreductase subunit A
MIKISKGLDLSISGAPYQIIETTVVPRRVAVLGSDYVGMKPTMLVKVGDTVAKGDPLFEDKKNSGVHFTAPAGGKVVEINRGARRVLESVVIEVGGDQAKSFKQTDTSQLASLNAEAIEQNLLDSGMWAALRTRPYSKIPAVGTRPVALFVTAMDTNPLAADAALVIQEYAQAFKDGLTILSHLAPKVHVCTGPKGKVEIPELKNVAESTFSGPHPAGLAGTHIHFLEPVDAERVVWTINYADVIAIGKLFTTGELFTERVISVAGPAIKSPCLVRTHLGASSEELIAGKLQPGENRVISGSVFSGREASGAQAYLGRYHLQLSVLEEGRKRELLGWKLPGFDKFSVKRSYMGGWLPWQKYDFTTTTHGSERAIVPIGCYEKVMPQDTEPTFLARSLLSDDVDLAESLGLLEMDEEDVGLMSFVCPGKHEYGKLLRKLLTIHERDG